MHRACYAGLRRAVGEEFQLAWVSSGSACGVDRYGVTHSRSYCSPYAAKVVSVLRTSLMPGDVLFWHNSEYHHKSFTKAWVISVLHPIVQSASASLVMISDGPKLRERATNCLPSAFAPTALSRCDTSLSAANANQARQKADLQSIASSFPADTYTYDLFDLYCEESREIKFL